jgi:hypothetical protein
VAISRPPHGSSGRSLALFAPACLSIGIALENLNGIPATGIGQKFPQMAATGTSK